MNRSIITTPSNKRVFGACLLSLMTLLAPIASVGAATRRALVPLSVKSTNPTKGAQPAPVEPVAAMPAPVAMPAPAPLLAVGPITATKIDSFTDADGDAKAELGETINYTVAISNTGSDAATGVTFNDNIDANTTFVPGSMHASPIAFDETYEWVGNTVLDTAARSLASVTANDVAVTDGFTVVTQAGAPTAQGGIVTLLSNGHFVYTPQLGDGGPGFSDSFTYTLQNNTDSTLVGTGTVTINMPVRVWYLQAGAGGDGRSLTPSGAPAAISGLANLPNDIFYVYHNAGTLNGAFILDSGQTLLGEGVALVANSIALRSAGSIPVITNSGGNAVTLGGNNLVTGLNISQANNFAIAGTSISGTTNVTGVVITNTTSGGGLSLTTQAGTVNFTNSPISGTTTGTAVFVNGGAGNVNFSNSPISRTTGKLIDIQNKTGGAVLFNNGSTLSGTTITSDAIVLRNHTGGTSITFSNNVNVTTSGAGARGIQADNSTSNFILIMNAAANTVSATGGAAVDVEDLAPTSALAFTSTTSTNSTGQGLRVNNTNGTMSFGTTAITGSANTGVLLTSNASTLTFGDLDITPATGQRALFAQLNTGAITIASGTVAATTAIAVEITGVNAGSRTPLNVQFDSLSSNGSNSAAHGLVLTNTSATGSPGGFRVNGSGTTVGSGGTIQNTTTRGANINTVDSLVLKNMNFTNANSSVDGGAGGSCDDLSVNNCNSAIYMNGVTTLATLDNLDITGTMVEHGITAINVANFKFDNSLIDNAGNDPLENGIKGLNLSGTATVNNTEIRFSEANNLDVLNNDVSVNLTISGSTFRDTQTSAVNGEGGLLFRAFSRPVLVGGVNSTGGLVPVSTINVLNSSFLRNRTQGIQVFASDDTVLNLDITGCTIDAEAGIGTGIDLNSDVAAQYSFNVTSNPTIESRGGAAINITSFLDSHMEGRVNNNPDIEVLGGAGIPVRLVAQETSDMVVLIDNNTVSNVNGSEDTAIDVQARFQNARVDATITRNTVTIEPTGVAGINLISGSSTAGEANITCGDVGGTSLGNNVTNAVGNSVRAFRVRNSDLSNTNRLYLEGFVTDTPTTWGNRSNVPAVPAEVTVSLTGTAVAPSAPPGGLCLAVDTPADFLRAFTGKEVSQATESDSKPSVAPDALSINSKVLLAKATVTGHKDAPVVATNRPISREEVRYAHARSNRQRVPAVVTNASFVAPMAALTPLNIGTLPGNKSVTVKFQVTVNTTGLASATSVSNQGTVSGTNFSNVATDDPAVGGPTDPTVTPISRLDVQVTKTDGVSATTPGSDLTYTLTYTNNDHGATGVVLTETVPAGTTFKAAGSSVWTGCADGAPAGTVCTIDLGTLPRNGVAGFTGTRTFIVTVLNPAPAGLSSIVNNASIQHDGTYEPDINTANNSTTDTDTLNAAPDLNISKSDGVTSTTPGSTLTYTINYSNVGTQNATGVVLTETVPAGTTFNSAGSSAWTGCADGSPAGTVCTINVGTLTAGAAAASATFAVVVTNPAAAGLASIVNTASIADDVANGTDPTLPNTATDTDTLDAVPDLTISKLPDVANVGPADTIVYTITYANAGNQNATGVVITETVPVHTTFSTADSSPTIWSCADNSPAGTVCTTTIGAVSGGGGGSTVKFAVKVIDPLPPGATQVSNTASIADDGGNGTDPTPANNTTGAVNTPIATCAVPPANMTNWWTGDGTTRDIAGGKDGTLENGATYGTGKVLQGFSLDGDNDYVGIGDVDLPSTFTIDAWINPTNLTNEQAIVNKDSGTDRSYFFNVTSTGALRALVHSGAGNFTQYQTADGVITAGSLQHVAVTYDGAAGAGAKMLFYKNGVLVASTVVSSQDFGGTPENIALAARIGRSIADTNAFIGVIDEVEFFSRVLAASELLDIFNADSGGKCKPSDLRITKSHSGSFFLNQTNATYTITVTNDGPAATSGTVTVADTLPTGLTPVSMLGTNWNCTQPAGPCTRNDVLTAGNSYEVITLTVNVDSGAPTGTNAVTNTATVSGTGGLDTSDDTANDPTTINTGPPNVAPVNSVPGAQATNEDTALVFNAANTNLISISDADAGANPVQVSLTTTNGVSSLSTTSGLSFACGGCSGDGTNDATMVFQGTITDINNALNNLTFTPTPNFNGPASIQIVTDDLGNTGSGGAQSDTDTINITVNGVNDPPSFTIASNPPASDEDAGLQTVNAFATSISQGAGDSGQTLTFNLTPTGTTGSLAFSSTPAIDSSTGNLTYTASANTNGTASFDVTLSDNGGGTNTSGTQSFTITVNAVNDPPSFTIAGNPPAVNEDAGAQTVNAFATSISQGPGETGQTLTFNLTPTGTTGNLAFSSGPAIDSTTGNLTYTSSADTFGTASFDVTLSDNGGGTNTSGTQSFTITVNGLNDAPSFTIAGNPPAITRDSGPQTVNGFATSISEGPGESGQTPLTFNVVAQGGATVTFSSAPAIDATTGNLTYTANAGSSGTATFDVTLTDSGPSGGGNVNTSGVQTFTITVLPNLALTVNNSGDAADNNLGDRICDTDLAAGLQCTLRAAIQETNAASTADTIGFDPSLNGGSINLLTALENITGDLAINGPGANLLTVQRSSAGGTPEFIIFQTGAGTIVSISGLTISNGRSASVVSGAGISIGSGGTLNLSFSTISGNTAGAASGVYNEDGTLTVTNSTFSGNSTLPGGFSGAAIHTGSGTTNIVNSTFSGNSSAQSGGAISVGTGTLNITNATITNNRADSDGNASGSGGGIANLSSGTVTLKNTIVFGNFAGLGSGTADDVAGNLVAGSNNNLIGTGGSGGLTDGVNNNQVGVVDARLGVLASNGGPTQTHALLARSVALDAGDDSVTLVPLSLTTDQRGAGFSRQLDSADTNPTATVDIGAFEADLKISGPGLYFDNSTVFLRNSTTPGSADFAFTFGASMNDYLAISGDWNKDGRDTLGLYHEATGNFFLTDINGPGPANYTFHFGGANLGHIPIAGDWDGDGVDTIGVYDPATSTFFLRNSNSAGAADIVFTFGAGNLGYLPVAGDWDGDGDDTIGVYDSTNGVFFLRNSNTSGPGDLAFHFGAGGNQVPVVGDWNGDGTTTVGTYVPSTAAFFMRNSNSAGPADVPPFTFSAGGGRPVAGDWAP